ncbi:MAG: SPOCS domain-containing protein [Bacillota bacterium]
MELLTNELTIDRIAGTAAAQAVVEGELPLPLEHSEAEKVLDAVGSITLLSVEVLAGMIMLDGTLAVDVICISPEGEPFSFRSKSNFRHTVNVEGAAVGMNARVQPVLQTLTVAPKSQNSLKLDALVDLYCRVSDRSPMRVMTGILGVNDLETLSNPVAISANENLGDVSARVREEIAAPNIVNVLSSTAEVELNPVEMEDNKALVEGVVNVNAICENNEGELVELNQAIPFGELAPLNANHAGNEISAQANVAQLLVRPLGEGFDAVSVEAVVDVALENVSQSNPEVLADAYSPSTPIQCNKESVSASCYYPPQSKKLTLRETVAVPSELPDIASCVYVRAHPVITASAVADGKLALDGLIFTRVVYRSGQGSLECFVEDIPFLLEMEVPRGATDADVSVKCLSAGASGAGRSVEVCYTILVCATPFALTQTEVVTGVSPAEAEEAPKGIVVYFAGNGETLWDVAKRFCTTKKALLSTNPNLAEPLKEGQKLVLFLRRTS